MSNREAYIDICSAEYVPVFLQPWWLDAATAGWDVAIARKGDRISGVWPYVTDRKIGVTILRNPRLTPYLGPAVFYPPDIKESNADSYEHETISGLMKQLPDAKVWHLAIQPGLKQAGLFAGRQLQVTVRQTFLLSLQQHTEDQLLANVKDTARRNIKQGEKELEITNEPACLQELYRFQKATLAGKGASSATTLADMQRVMDACLAHNAAALWIARSGGTIQAIVWQVWDAQCSYYLMGGQNHEANGYKAMTALLWHAVKQAKQKGHITFDFEGSMDEGVERFFRSFGGQRTLYLQLQKNDSPLWKLKKMIRK